MSDAVLDLPMQPNDADAATVRDYLKTLLAKLWEEEESFSGKRPLGNSGWQYDLYKPLVQAGLVAAVDDRDAAHKMIADAIARLS